jgi:hypothetical protein
MPAGGSSTKVPGQARPRYRLSAGGRPRTVPDAAELLVARAIGRNLSPLQGCVVQLAVVAVVVLALWAFFASGLAAQVSEVFAN